MHPRTLFIAAALAILLFAPSTALTNAAAPAEYVADTDDNTVEICPSANMHVRCGSDEYTMLRQNLDTGDVVALDSHTCIDGELACQDGPVCCWDDESCCFQDPCVDAGTYRYGASEFEECGACAGTDKFIDVVVDDEPSECEPTQHDAWDGNVPWETPDDNDDDNGDGGDDDGDGASDTQESTCNAGVGTVTFINLVAFGLGLLIWRRRSRDEVPA